MDLQMMLDGAGPGLAAVAHLATAAGWGLRLLHLTRRTTTSPEPASASTWAQDLAELGSRLPPGSTVDYTDPDGRLIRVTLPFEGC